MGPQYDPLIFNSLKSHGRAIIGIWILEVVHDGLSILMTVNENGNYEGQNRSEHRGYPQLRRQASNSSHGVPGLVMSNFLTSSFSILGIDRFQLIRSLISGGGSLLSVQTLVSNTKIEPK